MADIADTSLAQTRRNFLRAAALLILLAAGAFTAICLLLFIFTPNDALAAFAGLVVTVGLASGLSLRWLRRRPLGLAVLPISAGFVITVIGAWLLVPNFNTIGTLVLTIVVLLVSISGNRFVTLLVAAVCALLAMLVLGLPQPPLLQLEAGPALEIVKTLSGGAIVIVIWLIADRYTGAQDSAVALAEHRAAEAEAARAEAEAARAETEARSAELRRLLELVQALELPVIPIGHDVLVTPLVGNLDSRRIEAIQRRLLDMVARQRAHTVILDVTGISVIDTTVARALLNTAQAVRLLGAQTLISGISANIAQTLVGLGVALDNIRTVSDLGQALDLARAEPAAKKRLDR